MYRFKCRCAAGFCHQHIRPLHVLRHLLGIADDGNFRIFHAQRIIQRLIFSGYYGDMHAVAPAQDGQAILRRRKQSQTAAYQQNFRFAAVFLPNRM